MRRSAKVNTRKRSTAARRPISHSSPERIKFIDPPINELVIALYHLPILELKAQHIGLYWSRIRGKFPLCDQQPFIATPEAQQPFIDSPGEIFPLPRFWFFSNEHPNLVQIQRNAFMLNWRRIPGAGDYPHYEAVVAEFWSELTEYISFIKEEVGGKVDVVQRCELTYINLIEASDFFRTPSDVQSVLPVLSTLTDASTDDRQLFGLGAVVTYRVNSNLLVDLNARLGQRQDTGELALSFELKAHGRPNDLSVDSARAWYDAAHDVIYKMFLDVTSRQLQEKVWKLL